MSKQHLSRRQLLASLGAGAALAPFLPAQLAHAAPVKRFIVWWTPNGIFDPEYTPDGEGTSFKFRRILEPLEKFREKITVVKGLDFQSYFKSPVPNDHGPPLSHSLCATATTGGDKYLGGGPSIDQFIAQKMNRPGSYDGLSVATAAYAPHARVSYRAAGDAITAQTDQKKVFDTMFKSLTGAGVNLDRLRATRKSSIDVVRAELLAVKNRLGREDQRKIDAHLDHLRAQEIRVDELATKAEAGTCAPPDLSAHGTEQSYVKYGMRFADIMFTAMKCDFARVATFVWGGPSSNETFPWLDVNTRHHDLSHASKPQPGSADYEALTKVGRLQAEQFGKFLAMLDGVKETDGSTMLDNSVVLWTSEHKCKDGGHDRRDVPFLLAGSAGNAIKTGRVVRFDRRAHNDLYVTIANAMGFPDVKSFGDAEVCKGALPLT